MPLQELDGLRIEIAEKEAAARRLAEERVCLPARSVSSCLHPVLVFPLANSYRVQTKQRGAPSVGSGQSFGPLLQEKSPDFVHWVPIHTITYVYTHI